MAGDMTSPGLLVERVQLTVDNAVAAFLVLNRPDTLNALDWSTIKELRKALRAAEADPQVRVIFVTGTGRAFSAGGDLGAYLELQQSATDFPAFLDDLHETFAEISMMRKPVVALVNGVTAAGGLELLLSCDFAYAADTAKIGDAHLNFGQIGGGGSLALLPRAISPALARELVFSGRFLSAEEARGWGLVNKVVAADDLRATALAFATEVADHSPNAIEAAKSVMNDGWAHGTGLPVALRMEKERAALYCLTLPDSMEGLQRFAQRSSDRKRAVASRNGVAG